MSVMLIGIAITDLHGSLRNVRMFGPDGVELFLTEGVANPPTITFTWPSLITETAFEGHVFEE